MMPQQQLKLGDYGFAKVKTESSLVSSTVSKKKSIGTTRWRAPETFGKKPQWTPKADIYSLAITFYEILCQKIPFHEEADDSAVPLMIKEGDRPDLPEDPKLKPLTSLIESAWNGNFKERPTADYLLSEIMKIEEQLPCKIIF